MLATSYFILTFMLQSVDVHESGLLMAVFNSQARCELELEQLSNYLGKTEDKRFGVCEEASFEDLPDYLVHPNLRK